MRVFFRFRHGWDLTTAYTDDAEVFSLVLGLADRLDDGGWTPDLGVCWPDDDSPCEGRFVRVNMARVVSLEWWPEGEESPC